MWGDRFISCEETGYNPYEASENHTEQSRRLVPKDILICDWHYENQTGGYPSVNIFAEEGFRILLSPWRRRVNGELFLDYAEKHDKGRIEGVLMTTWCSSGELSRCILDKSPAVWENTAEIADTVKWIFE
mgnify:CR=1 FL=1